MNKGVYIGVLAVIFFVEAVMIIAPPVPHAISGYIFASGTTQVPLGTEFIVNDTNTSSYVYNATSIPVPGQSGRYSVTIEGEDGDLVYTLAWNASHFGRYDYTLAGVMNGVNLTLNQTRIEQNLSIVDPSDNVSYSYGGPFNITTNISALGGQDNQNCNVTLFIGNPGVINFNTGETSEHTILSITLGSTVSELWELIGVSGGTSNITVTSVCDDQTTFSSDNQDNLENITINVENPSIDTITLHPFTLLPDSTVTVWCNGTVSDPNGYGSLENVTGVIYGQSSTAGGSASNRNNYQDADCSTPTFNTSGEFACEFDVYFFAEPGTWSCGVNVTDTTGLWDNDSNTTTVADLLAIAVQNTTMNFGALGVGTDSGTDDTVVIIENVGNVAMDIDLDSYNESPGSTNAMDCNVGFIPTDNIRFNLTQSIDYSVKTFIPGAGSTAVSSFDLQPQTGAVETNPTNKSIYWGVGIPGSGVVGTCNGKILFTAISDI